jgi:hypothetical protein
MRGFKIIFKPLSPLKLDTLYTLTLKHNISDIDDISLGYDHIYTFVTRSRHYYRPKYNTNYGFNNKFLINKNKVALQVEYTNPSKNEEKVDLDTNIIINFNTEIDENTIGNNNFSIIDTNGNILKGNIQSIGNRVIFDPSTNLKKDTIYNVSLTTSIKSKDGEYLRFMYQFYFHTKGMIEENINSNTPTNIQVMDITDSSVILFWEDPRDSNFIIPNYHISYKKISDLIYKNEQISMSPRIQIYSLEPNTNYIFKIRAKNNKGKFSNYGYINIKTKNVFVQE